MEAKVVGIGQRRSGTSKKNGKPYDGTTLYVLTAANDVQGQKAEEVYLNHLSALTFPEVHVGDAVNVQYNRNGFMDAITVTKKA